jgi:hypothetical protein
MIRNIFSISAILILLQGCYKNIVEEPYPDAIFNAFWAQMNERYVSFEEKGINWDSVYSIYNPRINAHTTRDELKVFFKEILDYINDLHVSIQVDEEEFLTTGHRKLDQVVPRELISGHYFSRALPHNKLFSDQLSGNVSYISIPGFNKDLPPDSIRKLLLSHTFTGGIIIDIRDNHGGSVKTMTDILSVLCPDNFVAGYEKIKTGPKHNEFSDFRSIIIQSSSIVPADINKVVLINENVFSAGNIFAAFMKAVPNTIIMGTKSSGGAGYPVSVILPNNWILNFPRNKIYDKHFRYLDSGVTPDIEINIPDSYWTKMTPENVRDPLIERAMEYLEDN